MGWITGIKYQDEVSKHNIFLTHFLLIIFALFPPLPRRNLGFVVYIVDNDGLTVSTEALNPDAKIAQCVPTPFGSRESSSTPSTPVNRAKCELCGGDFFCSRNKTLPSIDFIDPLRSDPNDIVDQREITKLMVAVKGDFGLDAKTDVDPTNVANFAINDASLGTLQAVGSAQTWRCNTCYETKRFGIEMNEALEASYKYFKPNEGTGNANGFNSIQLKLPEKHAWCIAKVELMLCAKPGPPKIYTVTGIDGSDPSSISQSGGDWLEFTGQNLNNLTFKELRFGPEAKPAFVSKNCSFHYPYGQLMRCPIPRGIGGPYLLRVVTDSISAPAPPSVNITYGNAIVNQVTLTDPITDPQDEPFGTPSLRLDPDGGTRITMMGPGLLKSFADNSEVTMTVVSTSDETNTRGMEDATSTRLTVNKQLQVTVQIGRIGSSKALQTIKPKFKIRYKVSNEDSHITWPDNVVSEVFSNVVDTVTVQNVEFVFAQPEIRRTYMSFSQENETSPRTNLQIRVAGTGFCDNDECCQLRACDCAVAWENGLCPTEDLSSCVYVSPSAVCQDSDGGEVECNKKIDGWGSRLFVYPADQTDWIKKSIRLMTLFYQKSDVGLQTWTFVIENSIELITAAIG